MSSAAECDDENICFPLKLSIANYKLQIFTHAKLYASNLTQGKSSCHHTCSKKHASMQLPIQPLNV